MYKMKSYKELIKKTFGQLFIPYHQQVTSLLKKKKKNENTLGFLRFRQVKQISLFLKDKSLLNTRISSGGVIR